ncbi:hypothetical protein BpHYR1_030134 [Brachionus plicatilis]|uniref:Uncharacterized protein n=1 Tax=Brachionus plicatilis TaxID=10195 RepID=A0A3M7RM04_BRAPC|nr:hypothetical protein BpHYR1_030134 [Brachionus plicatilis]
MYGFKKNNKKKTNFGLFKSGHLKMTNRQVNGAQNYTPQASFVIAPQQQPMLMPNLNQQPLIAAINPQIPQLQPVYIIAGGSNMPVMNPFMYQYNSMGPLSNAPMQVMYYPQTFRPNPISSRQLPAISLPPKPLEKIIDKKETQKPPVTKRQKSKEVTMLYRYQKPITVNDLKHPSDKYKDLIYRPKFLTSKNIDPPTEELVPKLDVATMTPLVDIKSRINLTPSTGRGPFLVGDLKLPVEKVESAKKSVNKLPTLVEDLKLPVEKTPEPEIKKPEVKSELIQVPDPDLFKFIESSKNSLSYIGKFHYPPEVDFNDVAEIQDAFYQEKIEKLGDNRPKSVLVKVSFEKDSFELAKILFNPNVIVEFNQFIEAKKLDKESSDRPKSSKSGSIDTVCVNKIII